MIFSREYYLEKSFVSAIRSSEESVVDDVSSFGAVCQGCDTYVKFV